MTLKRTAPLRRSPLVRRPSNRLPCGSLRVHDGHTWTGQSDAREYRCPGAKPRKVLPRARMAAKRPAPAVPPSVRKALAARSGGFCEMRLDGCLGRATDPCHRIGRGNGGRHGAAKVASDRLANVVHGCRRCHEFCHDNPDAAKDLGLMLPDRSRPERARVWLPAHGGWVLLDDEGGVRPAGEAAA